MDYNIDEARVRIDHITVTSNDRRKIKFNPHCIGGYQYLGRKPATKPQNTNGEEKTGYSIFHEYRYPKTGNKAHIFTERYKNSYCLPNLSVKFFPTWEYPLKYSEVVDVMNCITQEHNVGFNLSQYHVAIDFFSKRNHLDQLVCWTLSGRQYDPDVHPRFKTTYYFHSGISTFQLIAYDKRKQLHDKRKLTPEIEQDLDNRNVSRFESRFYHTSEISTLWDLATHCFVDLYPRHLQFLEADDAKLSKHGIKPRTYRDLGLKGFRDLLQQHGITNNLFYYTRDNPDLSNMVKRALKQFKWCDTPDKHPITHPKLIIRPQGIRFIKH